MSTIYSMPITSVADMEKRQAWLTPLLSRASELPITFTLDGERIRGIPQSWNPTAVRRQIDANLVETVFEGVDPRSGLQLRVECTEYLDYPVVEWVAWLTNTGSAATPIIRDLLALDASFSGSSPTLYHCNGDFYSETGYTPELTAISPETKLQFVPNGGRPCDGAFPYYRLSFAEGGMSIAIGWPAQWAATFQGTADGVAIQAGQERTNLRLLPGERIRTPRISVLAWAGDDSRAINLWRRWVLAHVLPRPNGQPLKPLLAVAGTDEGEEFTAATTENQVRFIDRFREEGINFDVWWIDAGWYPCYNDEQVRRWTVTGTWKPDPERFPDGLKPVSDHVAKGGASLLLWFEPERVRPKTQLDLEHPEWLLRKPDNENSLLNLGNPECRQWLTDHVCELIQTNGIKIYRQDFNFPPLDYWRLNDAEDRQGMNENLHVQGYLQYWDDLLARNPGLWIDSCSSGGRRNDLETLRRSVPLHYTDYGYGNHPVKLAFQRTMYEWIPYYKEMTLAWDLEGYNRFDHQIESYSYHCSMVPMLFPALDIRRSDYDLALARKMIEVWRKAADLLLYGDYYPHTPFHKSAEEWVARQFDSPETGQGLIQAIRLPKAAAETFTVYPQGIRREATYRLENPETGETQTVAGDTLATAGFTFALPPRSGALWIYRLTDL
jgi:alpha-galactosidase